MRLFQKWLFIPMLFAVTALIGSEIVRAQSQPTLKKEYIYIGGRLVAIEEQAVPCTFTLPSPPNNSPAAPAGGSTGNTFSVSCPGGCSWTATSNNSWISITSGASGNGNGTVTYSVAQNTEPDRNGTITAGGSTYTVSQFSGCTYSISPTSNSVTASASTGSMGVTTGAGCAWTATSNAGWITITSGASGTGSGTVNYSIAANTTINSRAGTMTVAGQTFTVIQAGIPCTYSISPTSQSFTAAGGTGTISVTSPTGCSWTAASNATWITITSGASGTGSGAVAYSVALNNTGSARSGTITAAGVTYTVNQEACAFSISPQSSSPAGSASTGSISVTCATGCTWTATSNNTWITITSGASGSGNGTVAYSVQANPGIPRTGTITAAGQTFTVTQACAFSISPQSNSISGDAFSGSLSVTCASGCAWTATSNSSAWITITSGSSGNGNGSVNYSVAANMGGAARTGTITAAGNTFTVNQACGYTISPTSSWYPSGGGGPFGFGVQCAAGCSWTAATNAPGWITITSGSGSGNGSVVFSLTSNSGDARGGIITVAGKYFTVYQESGCYYAQSPDSDYIDAPGGGPRGFWVGATDPSCGMYAFSGPDWLLIAGIVDGGGGNYIVVWGAAQNTTGSGRAGPIFTPAGVFIVFQGP